MPQNPNFGFVGIHPLEVPHLHRWVRSQSYDQIYLNGLVLTRANEHGFKFRELFTI